MLGVNAAPHPVCNMDVLLQYVLKHRERMGICVWGCSPAL